jgi:glutamate carboxypeptidase
MRSILAVIVLVSVAPGGSSPLGAQQLSAPEAAIVQAVDRTHDQAIALLERIVNINSGTMNFDGVREVGRVLHAEFDALGFATEWIDGAAFGRSGHLVATKAGTGRRLLLIGHLDTVFERDSPFQVYEQINDSIVRGPGVADMKGGDVIIVHALGALREADLLGDMAITVVMTGDEESSGRPLEAARRALTDAADAADIALAFENGDNDPATGVIARRGFTGWELRVHARPAHSSLIFSDSVGAGAIYEAARVLNAFFTQMHEEQYLTFNPGTIVGGTEIHYDAPQSRGDAFGKTNVVPEFAVAAGDLRTISIEQREHAKQRMRDIVGRHLPHTSAEITFQDSYPPLSPAAGNRQLLRELSRVSEDLGLGPMTAVDPGAAGAADVSFVAGRVEMAIDGLGLTGAGDHTVEETANLNQLAGQTKKAAVLMYRLTREN